ncbi:ester cyclase [Microbacterium sp. YY-01]|uniref:ester cyclase n=1 Tax=Microbacterium sp. YY-01 TaxID=3421634 RepID=UPI003D172173
MEDVAARNKQIALEVWGNDLASHKAHPDTPGFREHFDKYYTQDYWNHASEPGKDRGFENAYMVRKAFLELFTDPNFVIDKVAADGDLVFLEGRFSAKHTGLTLYGIPATGVEVSQQQVHILRFRDFKISEHFVVRDDYEMYRQMVPVEQDGGILRQVDTEKYDNERQAAHTETAATE